MLPPSLQPSFGREALAIVRTAPIIPGGWSRGANAVILCLSRLRVQASGTEHQLATKTQSSVASQWDCSAALSIVRPAEQSLRGSSSSGGGGSKRRR
ncbi:hypothetical protein CCHR01_09684 [Colletotrichum chrysophilum]|uniref:Uncharacterized protein n=1 Tax=Colletotrichum chrysophilum TaxID=1836956 RepID=A0AAD9AJ63_9PEZI|nr:hypothetical protein CCHR01_09684 [Colletotrichum chrysophilum]